MTTINLNKRKAILVNAREINSYTRFLDRTYLSIVRKSSVHDCISEEKFVTDLTKMLKPTFLLTGDYYQAVWNFLSRFCFPDETNEIIVRLKQIEG